MGLLLSWCWTAPRQVDNTKQSHNSKKAHCRTASHQLPDVHTVFINVFNPHKSSTLNRPTSAPSSMPFISNFDFSYPKCHVFESHCRYQRIQSSWLLGWIFLLHKIARVCKTLMRGRLRRKWRRAQPAFFDMPVQSARTTKRKIFKWLFLLFFTT